MTDKNNNEEQEDMSQEDAAAQDEQHEETPATPTTIEEQLTQAAQQAEENLAGWKRAQADYQNLQKETQQRLEEMAKFGTESFIRELLPMVDHFKYALAGIPEEDKENAWVKGIEYIRDNFMKILEEHGVEMLNTVGADFNAELMEAIEEIEGDGKSGTVAEEMATGFKLNGKIIQAAKVKIYK